METKRYFLISGNVTVIGGVYNPDQPISRDIERIIEASGISSAINIFRQTIKNEHSGQTVNVIVYQNKSYQVVGPDDPTPIK